MQEEIPFGVWLRKQRRALELSRKAFANQVGCAQITLRRIEAGNLKPSKELANILFEKLGIPESERSLWVAYARGLSGLPFPSNLSKKSKSNLPAQLTSFIGREKEQADVIRLIVKNRLVTLTGPGGVGKTRLSTKIGESTLKSFSDGVFLVELAPILDPMLVPRTTALAIGLHTESQRPVLNVLLDFLHEKKMLIVLDNCEHLLDACAKFADALLRRSPNLKLLVTSREALGVMGEAVYPVPPLRVPNPQYLLENFRDFESVRLFEERAQLARIDFSLPMENASAVAKICAQLDGIPLAIELAAARVRTLSSEKIAALLQESFSLLSAGNRAALPRHQTLRAAIDWSHNLLSTAEQTLFRRLSVFVNGWRLEAAESICTDAGIKPDGIMNLLTQLVNKSLVIVEETPVGTRYRMLETIRQYAQERLDEAQEEEFMRAQHLNYFLKLSEQIEHELVRPQQSEWFTLTNDESSNLRSALEHACRTDVEAGLYISGRLNLFWEYSDIREGARWLADLLMKPASKLYPHARAKALFTQSKLLYEFEQFNEAQIAAEESLALFRAVGDPYGEVDSLFSLTALTILGSAPNPARGVELARQALHLAQSLGDIRRQAMLLHILGWDHRDFKRAFAYWEQAAVLYRQVGDWNGLAGCLSQLGFFLLLDGQLDTAQKYLDESKSLIEKLNPRWTYSLLGTLGQIALMRGDYEQARMYFKREADINKLSSRMGYLWAVVRLGFVELLAQNIVEARQIFTETVQSFQKDGNQIGVVFSLEGMSSLYVTVDKPEVAARLIGWTDATREKIGDSRPKLEQADIDKVIAGCIEKMGKTEFSGIYEEGKKMTLNEAIVYALQS